MTDPADCIHLGGFFDGRPACGTKAQVVTLAINPVDVTCGACKRTVRWAGRMRGEEDPVTPQQTQAPSAPPAPPPAD